MEQHIFLSFSDLLSSSMYRSESDDLIVSSHPSTLRIQYCTSIASYRFLQRFSKIRNFYIWIWLRCFAKLKNFSLRIFVGGSLYSSHLWLNAIYTMYITYSFWCLSSILFMVHFYLSKIQSLRKFCPACIRKMGLHLFLLIRIFYFNVAIVLSRNWNFVQWISFVAFVFV